MGIQSNENAKAFEEMHEELETTPVVEATDETVTEEVTEDVADETTDNVETEITAE